MQQKITKIIKNATGADDAQPDEVIQNLWSGYGTIQRYRLSGTTRQSVVVKHVRFPQQAEHPRGWNTDFSHQRKLRSYRVETDWYRNWSRRCGNGCPVPQCLALEQLDEETLMVLEDLDESGFPLRVEQLTCTELESCLCWLAHFHATFLGRSPDGLWPQGTYWHLATRPDELAALTDLPLKYAAQTIDQLLHDCPYRTIVHGDAKLANFCFSRDGQKVAAVDFQYAGGGCGMQDLAYFIGSCLSERECEKQEAWLLDRYFDILRVALGELQPELDAAKIEARWRPLYPVAWTDFHRFLKGWSPGHWKINSYSERLARETIAQLHKKHT